jgi:predicted amidophosphoribosyltransferase
MIHRFKHSHRSYPTKCLAKFKTKNLTRYLINTDLITHVPDHPKDKKPREYNPQKLLTQKLVNYFKISFTDDIIYAYAYRPSQTALAREKRSQNSENTCGAKDTWRDKKIALLDDVFTTDSTINGCCQTLRGQGTGTITVITLAKSL